ncbi:hypothetical protein GCM10027184_22520 [Saccharothrix stipae]
MYTMNLVLVAALTLSSYAQSEQSVTTVQSPSVLAGSVRITSDDSVRITAQGSVRITSATDGSVRITGSESDSVRITGSDADSVRITLAGSVRITSDSVRITSGSVRITEDREDLVLAA